MTLDGLSYSFNGYGEYFLLKITNIDFIVQARMTPLKGETVSNGTVFTGIAVKGVNIDSVQIEINDIKMIDIYINGIMETSIENFLPFNGFYLHRSLQRYLIQFTNGINIELHIADENNTFFIVTIVPEKYRLKTSGLLGLMDGDTSNDFILPNGTFLKNLNASNDKDIFTQFGENWRASKNDTIFSYFNGETHADYNKLSYIPTFISDGIFFSNKTLEALAKQQCGENKNCLFDVSVSGQLSIGYSNIEFNENIDTIQKMIDANEIATKVTCVPLNKTIENGAVTETNLENGFEYSFKCKSTYCLTGSGKIKCENGIYNSNAPKCVKCRISVQISIHSNSKILISNYCSLLFLIASLFQN